MTADLNQTIDAIVAQAITEFDTPRSENEISGYKALLRKTAGNLSYDFNLATHLEKIEKSRKKSGREKNWMIRHVEGLHRANLGYLRDSLLLFGYLTGKIKATYTSTGRTARIIQEFIHDDDSLHALKIMGPDAEMYDDQKIGTIYYRRHMDATKYNLPTYIDILNELGKHPKVKKRYGKAITYKMDIFRQKIQDTTNTSSNRGPTKLDDGAYR